jgi:uncharacterized SAM-binding protein YcdF (DUF218 family)
MKKRKLPIMIGVFISLCALFVAMHKTVLPLFADFLYIQSPPQKTQLVVAATATYSRFRYALELIKSGQGENLLLLGDTRIKMPELDSTKLELARKEAIEEGINSLFVEHSTSTRHDAQLTEELMIAKGWTSVTVISDAYNMRRVKMVFEAVFGTSPVEIIYRSPPAHKNPYRADQWWRSPGNFSYVISEWIKFPVNKVLLSRGKG